MRIEKRPVCEIERKDTYEDGKPTHVSAVRSIQRARIYYGIPSDNNSALVQVETRFANPPDGNPTLHHSVTFDGPSKTHEGMAPLERQRELLAKTAVELIPCGSCPLGQVFRCGLNKMGVRSHSTDTKFDPCSREIIGLEYAIELPAETQASDVKCIQP